MLYPLALKSPATRASTPNRFSTRTEMVRVGWAVSAEFAAASVIASGLLGVEAKKKGRQPGSGDGPGITSFYAIIRTARRG
jgi:hypothetical protein